MDNNWLKYRVEDLYAEPSRNGLTKPKRVRGKGYKMVNMGELFAYSRIQGQEMDRVPMSDKEQSTSFLEFGDLLIARQSLVESGVGKCSYVAYIDEPTTFESHIIRLRLNKNIVDPAYVYYYFNSPRFRQMMLAISNGVAAYGIRGSDLANLEIDIPPLPEQKAIASILGALDDKIELNLQMNKTLEEMAMTLYKHWFVDFGPFQDGEFVDSELGPIPEGWEVQELSKITQLQNGFAFKSKQWSEAGIPVVKIGSVKPMIVDVDQCSYVSEITANENPKFRLSAGDILVGLTGYVGETGVVPNREPLPLLNQRVARFVCDDAVYSFIYCIARSSDFKSYAESNAHGSAQANISTKALLSYTLALPEIETIGAFDREVREKILLIRMNAEENFTLSTLRDTLLPKLISGEIRVKEAVKQVADAL